MLQYENVFEKDFQLYARVYDSQTKKSEIIRYNSTEYIPDIFYPKENGKYTSFANGKPLEKKEFKTTKEYYEFTKQYKEVPGFLHGNRNRAYKYIRNNFPNPLESNHKFRTWFIDIEVRSIHSFASPDNPTEEISLIQIYDTFASRFIVLGLKPFTGNFESDYGEMIYRQFSDEKNMLSAFIETVERLDPTLIVGFNSDMFDIPYITNRIARVGLDPNELSPIGKITTSDAYSYEKIKFKRVIWEGRLFFDYKDLYQKYSYKKLAKYSLEYVADEELGEGKVSYSEYDGLEDFYLSDYNTFVDYGTKDVELLIKLEDKMKLIETAKLIGYTCGVNCVDVLGTLVQWQELMYREAYKQRKILPLKQMYSIDCPYPGGWVRSAPSKHKYVASFDFSSLYPSIIQFLNIGLDTLIKPQELPDELYQLKKQFFYWYTMENKTKIKNLNDNTEEMLFIKNLIENKEYISSVLRKYNVCAAPNGLFYSKETESIFASFMKKFYSDRKLEKKKLKEVREILKDENLSNPTIYRDQESYHSTMEITYKLLMNSAYGSTALAINCFSHGESMSEAITTTGRIANRWVAYRVNEFLADKANMKINLLDCALTIQADTDSNYFTFKYVVPKELSEEEKLRWLKAFSDNEVQEVIKKAIEEIALCLNAYNPDALFMEQEIVCDTFISVADKRYVGRYFKNNKPQYKITGLSIIGKSTPHWCKEKLQNAISIIMDGEPKDIVSYIEGIRQEFYLSPIEQICSIKGMSSLDYDLKNGKFCKSEKDKELTAPIHSRGAIMHNKIVSERKLSTVPIRNKDKVFYAYLLTPNVEAYNQNIISFTNPKFIHESGLDKIIDYDLLFQKNFIRNIELITKPIGISLDKYVGQMDLWE